MKKTIATLLVSSLLLVSCGKTEQAPEASAPEASAKAVKIETAKMSAFVEEVKFVGKIAAERETIISSQTSGVIKSLDTTIGKRVVAWEKLAAIDYSSTALGVSLDNASTAYQNALTSYSLTRDSIEKDLESARIALENARTSKENTYTSTEKQLQLAETQLDNILTTRANTEKTTTLSVELAQKSRASAELNLANFEKTSAESIKTLADKKSGLYDTIRASIDSSIVTIDASLTQADLILGVTEKNKGANDAYEIYLGARDTESKNRAEDAWRKAKDGYDALVRTKNLSTPQGVESTLRKARTVVADTIALYDGLVVTLDNSVTSSSFPQTSTTSTSLDGLKATAATKQSTLLASTQPTLVSLANSLDDLNNTISSTETSVATTRASLQTALDIASTNLANAEAGTTSSLDTISGNETLTRTQLENTIASVKSARDSVDNAVRTAEAQYQSTKAKLQTQLTSIKTQTDASKSQKSIAGIQFDNGLIKAPFAGVILSKSIEVGGLVNPGTPTFTIGDDSTLIVRTEVNADVIKSLTLGQIVRVDRAGKTFTGTISLLSPGADSQTKMFRVEARIQNPAELARVGNIGDLVDIRLSHERPNTKAISVPLSALMAGSQGEFNVYTIDGQNTARIRSVKIGAQNANSIEILSGLTEGDKYVAEGALNIQEGEKVEERK